MNLDVPPKYNIVDYDVRIDRLTYKVAKWSRQCRVVFKIEKLAKQLTFIVTIIESELR